MSVSRKQMKWPTVPLASCCGEFEQDEGQKFPFVLTLRLTLVTVQWRQMIGILK